MAALTEVGCPPREARDLAARARIERRDGEWLLLLLGHGTGIDVPVTRSTWAEAAEHLAQNVAGDNAEAVDRSDRGETGWAPWWPLPERRPRTS